MARKGTKLLLVIIFVVVVLFVVQNGQRPPKMDHQGGYLSLDMYFFGFKMIKPVGVSFLMLGSFCLGLLTCALYAYFRLKKR